MTMKNYFFNKHELSNGIEIYINSTPQFITTTMGLEFYIPLTKEEAGKTATLANVLVKGSKNYPTLQNINSRLADLKDAHITQGISEYGHLQGMHFTINALTDPVSSAEESPFDATLEVLEDILTNPYLEGGVFSNSYVQQSKDNLERTILELINDKRGYASEMLYKELYPNSPYGLSVYGDLEAINQINEENLYEHYKKMISEANLKIFITGSKSEEEYLNQLERHFSKIPKIKDFKELLAAKPDYKLSFSREPKHEKMEGINESQLFLVYQHDIDRRDKTNHSALKVYNSILGGGSGGLLFQIIREQHSLAYSASSSLDNTLKLIKCYAGIGDHNQYEKTVGLIKEQINQLRRGKFTNKDVAEKRNYLISLTKQALDNPYRRIAEILDLVLNDVFDLQDYSFGELKAVKKKDVRRIAEIICPDKNFTYFLRPR